MCSFVRSCVRPFACWFVGCCVRLVFCLCLLIGLGVAFAYRCCVFVPFLFVASVFVEIYRFVVVLMFWCSVCRLQCLCRFWLLCCCVLGFVC